ncbi:PadR family transcriptional regulator [uncultured Cohaesibacter sp.]|uniref:PadR family transcriptional regulator n=1 Tax=uncultured Cohaesibacter sp. TaxID=1002546 RepID=UPI00292E9069|nr:PadR family transcriptional regulator [uncultured Cohaesibacter sp.]
MHYNDHEQDRDPSQGRGRHHHHRRHEDRKGRQERKREHIAEWLASGGAPFRPPFRGGRFGRGSDGGGEGRRRGRMLAQGDIRLLSLALIEQEPRHGYDIIKEIEAMTDGAYAPSPGVIYPTLTYLEEANYTEVQSDGNKKKYAITDEGKIYLDENRDDANRIIEHLEAIAERSSREDRRHGRDQSEPELPRSVEAALLNLRETAAEKIKQDPAKSSSIVKQFLELADEL